MIRDPVIDPEGNSYEREAITNWLAHNTTSPITRTLLTTDQLIPNRSLRNAIEDEQTKQKEQASPSESSSFTTPSTAMTNGTGALAGLGVEPAQPTVSLSYREGAVPHTLELLASITPPADVDTERSGCDVCCVVDVSGSMGNDASIPGAENSGLTLLDVTKHALKTVITSLKDHDRLSLVSYSSAAKVICGLTPMTAAGKSRALSLVDTLQPDGMTNLWDGLKKGLDTLTEASSTSSSASGVRNAAVFILTDGEPNVEPPRGHIPMLQLYREKHQGRFPGTISTFGFGYGVKSVLLQDIAVVGGGMYAFIPDSGFVGTAFVNALANQLATMAMHAVLSVELPSELHMSLAAEGERCFLGQSGAHVTSWGATVDVGSVKFGQKKDVAIRMAVPEGVSMESLVASGDFLASFAYTPLSVHGHAMRTAAVPPGETVVTTTSVLPASDETTSYVAVQTFRSETILVITDLMEQKLAIPAVEEFSTAALTTLIGAMREWLRAHPKQGGAQLTFSRHHFDLVEGLMKDLAGQVTEAIDDQYFKKWGRHFLPSLARAHQLQECLNFKDPGVQHYGGNLFQTERDFADDAFNNLPAPTPSARRSLYGRGGHSASTSASSSANSCSAPSTVSMTPFNSASAPCFHGDCLVHLSDGSLKAVAAVQRGDRVLCNTHHQPSKPSVLSADRHVEAAPYYAEVECVVQTQTSSGVLDLVHFAGGLQVTPYHPLFCRGKDLDAESESESESEGWRFPVDMVTCGDMRTTNCSAVYSFLLGPAIPVHKKNSPGRGQGRGRAESMVINGWPCITLAHGIAEDSVATHEFYGTERVVTSLQEVAAVVAVAGEGWEEMGRVILQEGCVCKDPDTGRACGFLLHTPPQGGQ